MAAPSVPIEDLRLSHGDRGAGAALHLFPGVGELVDSSDRFFLRALDQIFVPMVGRMRRVYETHSDLPPEVVAEINALLWLHVLGAYVWYWRRTPMSASRWRPLESLMVDLLVLHQVIGDQRPGRTERLRSRYRLASGPWRLFGAAAAVDFFEHHGPEAVRQLVRSPGAWRRVVLYQVTHWSSVPATSLVMLAPYAGFPRLNASLFEAYLRLGIVLEEPRVGKDPRAAEAALRVFERAGIRLLVPGSGCAAAELR